MPGGVSRISNTRSTEASDCWVVLAMRESWRTGPYRRSTAAVNEKNSPGVSAPEITR